MKSVYLKVKKERFRFPLTPDKITVKRTTQKQSFTILGKGERQMPRGVSVKTYTWNSTLPGKSMSNLRFVRSWQRPDRIIKKLEKWQENNTILKLSVTETVIRDDVFIDSFIYDYAGYDNVTYSITLIQYIPLKVKTAKKQPEVRTPRAVPTSSSSSSSSSSSGTPASTGPTDDDQTPVDPNIPTGSDVTTTPTSSSGGGGGGTLRAQTR